MDEVDVVLVMLIVHDFEYDLRILFFHVSRCVALCRSTASTQV